METVNLFDACVLIALGDDAHTAHQLADNWFESNRDCRFATCPITQMALLRHMLRTYPDLSFQYAKRALERICKSPNHEFWSDTLDCLSLPAEGVRKHGHVTDAYLVNLAKAHGGRIATLDERMADIYAPIAFLIL